MSPRRDAFTLIEMLVVVAIVGILAAMISPVVLTVRERGRQADCKSNLRQFGTALIVYRAENNGANPDWLSNLYPEYVDDKSLYICKSDPDRGLGELSHAPHEDLEEFFAVRDNIGRHGIIANSYFYEFSAVSCSWCDTQAKVTDIFGPGVTAEQIDTNQDGVLSWNEVKEFQLRHGDASNNQEPYGTSRFPIIRCFHHHRQHIRGYADQSSKNAKNATNQPLTYNVAYAGNVFAAPLWWEGRLEPGE